MSKKIIKLAFCFSLMAGAVAFAQEAATAAPEAAVAATVEKTTLWEMIKQGGWTMYPLGLFSMGMVYFIVQNGLALREKVLLRPDLMPEFISLMRDKKILDAHSLCKENETLFTYVFAAGLERCSTTGTINFGKIKEAIEEASTEEVTTYMKPVDYLSIIGATAPMLGLLGTVSGMIKAFQTIGTQGMGKPQELAGNIGEALVTTATGLIIAIPSMLFYYYFRNNFIKSTATCGRQIGALLDTLESGELPMGYEDMGSGKKAKKSKKAKQEPAAAAE
jgi:biopolymer transport protein ExbB